MFNIRQTTLAMRPAAMVLALLLVAVLSVPVLLLPRADAAGNPPLPCTQANYNGCTELSPTPPEDMVRVPPNIVLMLDDSGSMAWDFMPDWDYLKDTNRSGGLRDAAINGVYYNPTTVYTPPPQADGTLYPDSNSSADPQGLTSAFRDGFLDRTHYQNITRYDGGGDGHSLPYWEHLKTTNYTDNNTDYGPAVWGCPSGYYLSGSQCISNNPQRNPVSPNQIWRCELPNTDWGPGSHNGDPHACRQRVWTEHGPDDTWYTATHVGDQCPGGTTLQSDGLCHYPVINPVNPRWMCTNGSPNSNPPAGTIPPPECVSSSRTYQYIYVFAYVTGNPYDQANPTPYVTHYVAPGTGCDDLFDPTQKANCVNEGDTTGKTFPDGTSAAPHTYVDKAGNTQVYLAQNGTPLTPGQNVANWFSYYRTRMLMAKSGLMNAFSNLDQTYRFGFASINGNGKSNIPSTPPYVVFSDYSGPYAGDQYNRLAVVQPFGLGSDPNSQRSKFWTWIANETPNNGTPLRLALKAVGEYYKTGQPWTTMQGDPGYTATSTTKFACRASYTILTTDGFWNGNSPGVGNADNTASGPYTVPTGKISGYTPAAPFADSVSDTLADVAMQYWKTDLKTGSDWPNEVSLGNADPASWQHMTTFTVGLGFDPTGIQPPGTTVPQILGWAHAVDDPTTTTNPTPSAFAWPNPSSNSVNNIADLAHAAVNGHGDFFNVKSPEGLANAFKKALSDISARNSSTPAAAVNASVLSLGALSFSTGYDTSDWSGSFDGVTLKTDGTVDTTLWSAGTKLNAAYHSATGFSSRTVYTDSYTVSALGVGTFTPFQFNSAPANVALLDTVETAGLQSPALAGSFDTLAHRIDYLLGDNTYENADLSQYRPRTSLLGAIIRSDPVYVAGATGNYYDSWPAIPGSPPTPAPETGHSFGAFVTQQSTQPGMVYVGANDGMLHAFRAPVPNCSGTVDSSGNCSAYNFATGAKQGEEAWAFVPRAVYANLGNLTLAADFHFRPTVDATPVRRDVFFSETVGGTSHAEWHTILAGGVGIGGRGVYALDITHPASFSAADVLWEFDSDMIPDSTCVASYGTCKGTDLGYTVSQPNISRLHNGLWAVLVPNGYFPDCSTPDTPTNDLTNCQAIAAQAPKDSSGNPYSALFVLDAQTGRMIAELKTPTDISGVTSFGLATPVMGDYNNDQVDDVAFAGDVQGNLWRFDLSSSDPSSWTVTLVYKGLADANGHQGLQPITTMPRLFPDPVTNRFMVVFGTGKFLGVGDNGTTTTQSLIAVRDVPGSTYTQSDLTQQYVHETTISAGATLPDGSPDPRAGATLRCVTGGADDNCTSSATPVNDVPASSGGWFINLYTTTSDGTQNDAGERVVVNPGAIFASNTVIFETLITGSQSSDVCNPQTQGSILALNATSGAPAGVSSLGGWPIAGGRINNARTSGSLPVVSALGGGQAYLPGATLAPSNTTPMSIDAPMWRRRSWQEINQNQ